MPRPGRVGNFRFYTVHELIADGLDGDVPVAERTDAIRNTSQCDRIMAASKNHLVEEAVRRHIILYSPAGVIVPLDRKLWLTPSTGERPEYVVLPTGVAYGRLGDATPEVLDELPFVNLERLVRMNYDTVSPDGWCSIFLGNFVVKNK